MADIQHGWDVYGSDEEKVGNVSEVRSDSIVARKGFLFPKDLYIPRSAITRIEHDRVYLNVAKADVERQGWDNDPGLSGTPMTGAETTREHIPDAIGTPGLAGSTDEGGRPVRAAGTTSDGMDMGEKGWAPAERRAGMAGDTGDTVHLHEEQLQVNKQRQQTGEARIGKEVVEEQRTVNVPVTREEVYVERVPGDRQPDTHSLDESASENITVPISEERLKVEKVPVTTEEVRVGKREVTDNRQVTDTVRREQARIETGGDTRIQGDADTMDQEKI